MCRLFVTSPVRPQRAEVGGQPRFVSERRDHEATAAQAVRLRRAGFRVDRPETLTLFQRILVAQGSC